MSTETIYYKFENVKMLRCTHCKHEWKPRNENKLPCACPACMSRNWMKPRERAHHTKTRRNIITKGNKQEV